jgi:hypothetical protein
MPRASPARPASNADHDTLSASPGAEKNPGNRKLAVQTLQVPARVAKLRNTKTAALAKW